MYLIKPFAMATLAACVLAGPARADVMEVLFANTMEVIEPGDSVGATAHFDPDGTVTIFDGDTPSTYPWTHDAGNLCIVYKSGPDCAAIPHDLQVGDTFEHADESGNRSIVTILPGR